MTKISIVLLVGGLCVLGGFVYFKFVRKSGPGVGFVPKVTDWQHTAANQVRKATPPAPEIPKPPINKSPPPAPPKASVVTNTSKPQMMPPPAPTDKMGSTSRRYVAPAGSSNIPPPNPTKGAGSF